MWHPDVFYGHLPLKMQDEQFGERDVVSFRVVKVEAARALSCHLI